MVNDFFVIESTEWLNIFIAISHWMYSFIFGGGIAVRYESKISCVILKNVNTK